MVDDGSYVPMGPGGGQFNGMVEFEPETLRGEHIQVASIKAEDAVFDAAAIQSADIADAQITTAKIDDLAVTTLKVGGLAITTGKIDDGAVETVKIANLAVTDAKIDTLQVGKLTAGAIQSTEYVESSNFLSGSDGWQIDGSGNAEFNNVTVRGTVDSSTVQSSTITGGKFQTAGSNPRFVIAETSEDVEWYRSNDNQTVIRDVGRLSAGLEFDSDTNIAADTDFHFVGRLVIEDNLNVSGGSSLSGDSNVGGNFSCDGSITGEGSKTLVFNTDNTVTWQ